MALAVLDFIGFEHGRAKFTVDTGTNTFYSFRIGKTFFESGGDKWVDDVSHRTPVQAIAAGGSAFNTSREVALPAALFSRENCYVQLFSYKNREGKSPSFSRVIRLPVPANTAMTDGGAVPFSQSQTFFMAESSFASPRCVPHSTRNNLSRQASVEEILSGLLRVAGPAVSGLLSGLQNNPAGNGGAAAGSNTAGSVPQLGMLNTILNALLHGLNTPAVSTQHSLTMSAPEENRFMEGNEENFSRPFIFGIDDALLATLAGPLLQQGVQLLPQLMNSMNQQKMQTRLANNKLMTDLVADTNRRMMLQQFLQNQQATPGAGIDINALMQLLQQQAPAAGANPVQTPSAPATPAPAAAPATSQSFSLANGNGSMAATLSAKSVLTFDTAPGLPWNGSDKLLFTHKAEVKLNVKLAVTGEAPKNPLPKAIIGFHFKDAANKTVLEKVFKQKNILPNTAIECVFTKEEIASLPANRTLHAIAEMRWLTAGKKEVKCLGSAETVFVDDFFLKEQGKSLADEKELADMKVYRAFWNKVWEAPVLEALNKKGEGQKKYNWELDATLKYNFSLTYEHPSNGLMETKIAQGEKDRESMTEKTSGRMKGGAELSLDELNKLCSMWDKQPLLPPEKLAALKTDAFVKNNEAEAIYHLKLKGRTGERGMIWVLPVLKLFECTLSRVVKTNDKGQITEIGEEKVQFPLPVSARIIGLKSA